VDELLRLLQVANAYEFMDAVTECREALVGRAKEWEDAVRCFTVFHRLSDSGVEGMKEAADKMLRCTCALVERVSGLWEPCIVDEENPVALRTHRLVEKITVCPQPWHLDFQYLFRGLYIHNTRVAASAFRWWCLPMPYIHTHYAHAIELVSETHSRGHSTMSSNLLCIVYPNRSDRPAYGGQALPSELFSALITAEDLVYASKNESFWLLSSWINAQSGMSEQEKRELFLSTAEKLEWHKMTPQYLQNVVLLHEYVQQSTELRLAILQDALYKLEYRRRRNRTSYDEKSIPAKYKDEGGDRALTSVTIYVTAQEIKEAQSKPLIKGIGVLAGVPWIIKLENKVAAGSDQTGLVSVEVCPCFRNSRDDRAGGLFVNYRVIIGKTELRFSGERVFHLENQVTWVGMIAKPSRTWNTFFSEHSPYFDKNRGLHVGLTTCFV
jgi:hypothetical protein